MLKGRDAERAVGGHLEAAGFEVYQPPHAKFREQDVFGLFDLLAFGHGLLMGIQLKTGRDASGINQWARDARVYAETIAGFEPEFWHYGGDRLRRACLTAEGWEWYLEHEIQGRLDTDGALEIDPERYYPG